MRQALSGVDILVHITGIHLSRLLVQVAVDCGVRRLILVHTTGIYSKYKQAGEEYRKIDGEIQALCESSGTVLTILRPTMIYGDLSDNNVARFIRMVDRLPFMPVVRGARYWLQPVWYEDLAEAYYRVLLREKEAGGWRAFWMDVKCFFGSFRPVATAEGVSEGKNVDKSESNE